jgi:DNA-binding MarR family transcriptional regulator
MSPPTPNAPGAVRPVAETADALVAVAPLAVRWIERLLASHRPPLTVAQLLALRAIADDDVTGSELARRTGVSGPAVSQLLAGLVDAGLATRSPLEDDRRRWALGLSPAGRRALQSALSLLRKQFGELLGGLARPQADALARALPRVEALLSGAPPPRRPPARPPARPRSAGRRCDAR